MDGKTCSLLIVDDEQDTCTNLSDIFSEFGYRVDTANDGPSALALADRNSYDVALLDLKMPGMNGLELYRELRRRSAETVAIVVTAFTGSETAKSVLEAGAWRIVSKPVKLPELMSFVDEAVSQPLVMIIDDDHDLCQSLWDLFRENAYRVCLAHDLKSGVDFLRRQKYGVVLIDMKLPDADGVKVLETVREFNPAAKTLIITGFPGELHEPVKQALDRGASAVCYKPFDVGELLATVATARQMTDAARDRASAAVVQAYCLMHQTNSLTALIVEDDADTRANLQDILELDEWQVETASTAKEVLRPRGLVGDFRGDP